MMLSDWIIIVVQHLIVTEVFHTFSFPAINSLATDAKSKLSVVFLWT